MFKAKEELPIYVSAKPGEDGKDIELSIHIVYLVS
jgi:hypothetical protein